MLSKKVEDALNKQIVAEMWSANLYLSMSLHFASAGLNGLAHWMKTQHQEEMEHAFKLMDYIVERGGAAKVDKIDTVPHTFGSPREVFEQAFAHEKKVSDMINKLVDVAKAENDKATAGFLNWFIEEQVEEEATASGIVDKFKLVGDSGIGIYLLDKELGKRKDD